MLQIQFLYMSAIKDNDNKISYQEIDPVFIAELAYRLSANKDKYPVGNWKKGLEIPLILDSIDRHLTDLKLLILGERPYHNPDEFIDDHIAAITANLMFLRYGITKQHVSSN